VSDVAKETHGNRKRNSYIHPNEILANKNHAADKNYRGSVGGQLAQSHSTISAPNFQGISNGPQDLRKKSKFSGAPSRFRFGEQKLINDRMPASGVQQIKENSASSDSSPKSQKSSNTDPDQNPNGHPDNLPGNDPNLTDSKYSEDSGIESSDLELIIDHYGR
jgi:hypothetical protein